MHTGVERSGSSVYRDPLDIIPKIDDIPTLATTGGLADHVLWDAAIEKLFSGESGSVTFVPETPGNYYFLCTLPGHAAGGMMGEFVVTE